MEKSSSKWNDFQSRSFTLSVFAFCLTISFLPVAKLANQVAILLDKLLVIISSIQILSSINAHVI